ncbi:GH12 family glycosyl hydrolase domain-containing protein [Hyalangium versicolor]|uniref:GH12 family glycosyl hydrolase domain-containing protein n=1 Tax=Hyalangium versicolor TaxID=2861190 RepID=UPI001CC9BB9D|nr:hypothetical protein [Hyalangium versicolor]
MPKQLIACALTLVFIACSNAPASKSSALEGLDPAPATTEASVSVVSSSVSKDLLIAGQLQSASVTLTSTATLQNLIVDIRIYDSTSNMRYARQEFSPVNLPAGAQQLLTFDFQSPPDMPPGLYDIRVGVWDTSWNTLLYETRNQFRVRQVSVVSSSISSNPLTPGQVQSASVTLMSSITLQNLIVDIRIYDSASNTQYARQEFSPVNLPAGSPQPLTFDFQSPSNMPSGTYDIRVGVWDTSWNTLLYETREQFTVSGTPFVMNCEDEALPVAGSYAVHNNQWGRAGVSGPYSQCVANGGVTADGSVSARWTWTWPEGPNDIKAYPAIVFGQKPGYPPTPNTNLPILVDAISQVTSSWSTQSSYTGTGQLTFDLFLTRDADRYPTFNDTPITHEIMIAVEPYNGYGLDRNPAWFVEEITINGVLYKTYKAEGFGVQGWRFLVFQMQTPMMSGSLDLQPLFDYLRARGFIQGNEYLSSIEFGSEVHQGTGDVTVDSFKATVH